VSIPVGVGLRFVMYTVRELTHREYTFFFINISKVYWNLIDHENVLDRKEKLTFFTNSRDAVRNCLFLLSWYSQPKNILWNLRDNIDFGDYIFSACRFPPFLFGIHSPSLIYSKVFRLSRIFPKQPNKWETTPPNNSPPKRHNTDFTKLRAI
jgi:hypothetical protein